MCRTSAAAVSAAAVAGGCREEDVDDWSVCIDSAATIPVARLVDIWLPLCMILSGESARPIGYPRAETPT